MCRISVFQISTGAHVHCLDLLKIHRRRQSIVKAVDSDLRIYCYVILVRSGTIYGFIHRSEVSIVGSLRDREVACSASDRQGSNFESCVWRTVSSQSSHHPQEVLLAQFSLYVHKGGLKPDSFHFIFHRSECLIFHDLAIVAMKLRYSITKSGNVCTYSVYFKSKKELNYNRFVDLNIYEYIEFRSFFLK